MALTEQQQAVQDLSTASVGVVAAQGDDAPVIPASQVNQSVEVTTAGRVSNAANVVGSNISGTSTVTLEDSQTTPPANLNSTQPQAPASPGVGAGNEDSATPNKNATQTEIDNVFNTGAIVPQANLLDQYSSYTYQASVYLMKPEAMQELVRSGKRTIAGSQLLFQSGGAPVGGRNPYFSNDYYIDKFELKSIITGKGTNAAHNVSTISMTVVEPNGITLVENLDKAVQDYLGTAGGKKTNFLAQLFLLVVRFYGYDQNGNLVTPNSSSNQAPGQATPSIALVEKYYPFALNKLNFKIADKLVEYSIEGTAVQYQTNVGQARGVIPYNVELSGMTVKDALLGPAVTGTTSTTTGTAAQTGPRDEQAGTNDPNQPAQAPPKAIAAPNPKFTIRQGLITALNQYQQDLVKQGIYSVADQYEVEFVTNAIESATIQKPGASKDSTGNPTGGTAADQTLPEKQSVDTNTRILTATAGKSLVQFIDEVVRNSSYVQAQQNVIVNEQSGVTVPNGKANNLAWYKIGLRAVPIKYDPLRNDYAYKMTFVIHPYKISEIVSPYFNKPKFPGHHKQYNYWFTGQNTQVLAYEQTYNALYYMPKTGGSNNSSAGTDENVKQSFAPNSAQSSQGAKGRTNEPAANAADYLYSPGDNNTASLTIVGDPAWLQQGEAFAGSAKNNFNFGPFLPDGTINFDSGQILFEVVFNTPGDYNLSTGLMDPNQQVQNTSPAAGQPAVKKNRAFSYIANLCTSTFAGGKFTQQLQGTRTNYTAGQTTVSSPDAVRTTSTAPTTSRTGTIDGSAPNAGPNTGNNADNKVSSPTATETAQPNNDRIESQSTTQDENAPPTPLPADRVEPPTSDGVVLNQPNIASPDVVGVWQPEGRIGRTVDVVGTQQADLNNLESENYVNTTPPQLIVKEA